MPLVKVWPLHDNILDGTGRPGAFMSGPREVDLPDPHGNARLKDGSIVLHAPSPVVAAPSLSVPTVKE